MDNQEHHPHVIFSSETCSFHYSQDCYKSSYHERDDNDDDTEYGCGCMVLFGVIFVFIVFFALLTFSAGNCKKNEDPDWLRKEFLEMEAEKAAKIAREKAIADSIERYNYLCDSITKAQYVQDSINLSLVKDKKVSVDLVAFIDDGVTSREVTVNVIGDSITIEGITELGKTFNHMAWTAAKNRQEEIDNNQEYYTKRIINEEQ